MPLIKITVDRQGQVLVAPVETKGCFLGGPPPSRKSAANLLAVCRRMDRTFNSEGGVIRLMKLEDSKYGIFPYRTITEVLYY